VIADFLRPEAILLQLDAKDSSDIITRLGSALHQLGIVKDNFIQATLDREASMPTGLPLAGEVNAAIPHVDVEYVNQPAVGLATLKHPVTFQNMIDPDEAVPVQLVIMLALDQPKSQVEMLQQISAVLQDETAIDRLMRAQTPEDVYDALN